MPGDAPQNNQSIVIEGGKITRVEDGFIEPAEVSGDVTVIDLSDKFVLPGLMDMHVHLLFELGPNDAHGSVAGHDVDAGMKGAMYAKRTLDAGFTTVRDLGGNPRRSTRSGTPSITASFRVPRIIAAGSSLAATGGHGDVDGVKAELLTLWTPETICDGPYDCRRATRYAIKYGADWIKITATGGVLSDTATGTDQQMTDDELKEIMDTAHGLGVRVAAHAHGHRWHQRGTACRCRHH